MERTVTIKWNYLPEDFFEEEFLFESDDYRIEINEGEISAIMPASIFDDNESIIDEISGLIRDFFSGAQVISQEPYNLQLSNFKTYTDRQDGKQDIGLSVSSGSIKLKGGKVDFILTDSGGKIISDTKAERIEERKRFVLLSGKYRDKDLYVKSVLDSFNASVDEPHHSLSHLYDILEALKKKFGNEKEIKQNLGIGINRIKRLRVLSNVEPLIEGRHVGYHAEELRNATNQEIEEARTIATELIYRYLTFLEAQDLFKK